LQSHVEIGGIVTGEQKLHACNLKEVNIDSIVPVQPQTYTVVPFYAKASSRSVAACTTDSRPQYIPDRYQNLTTSSAWVFPNFRKIRP